MKNNELENELEKISNLGIKLLNSARNNGVAIPEKHSDRINIISMDLHGMLHTLKQLKLHISGLKV